MGDPQNYKTVFVLDHCKNMRELSGVPIEIDLGSRAAAVQGYFPFIPSLMKSLWTCMAENTLEYARIVWDVFGQDRLIRFITSNPQSAISLNSWNSPQQTMTFVTEAFAAAGPPLNANGSVQVGIKAAVEALAEPYCVQKHGKEYCKNTQPGLVSNRGRIICITSCVVDFDIQEFVLSTLVQHAKLSAVSSDRFVPIDVLEFTLISLHPVGKESLCRVLSRSRVSPVLPFEEQLPRLSFETYVVTPPTFYDKLIDLVVEHHNLVTTTVTGIPMKEEATSSSSINYDVPLFHPRTPFSNTDTQILKWSGPTAPKGMGPGSMLCNTACRITPVEVISRPTTCLSNFVLNGRSVWLESPKKTATSKAVTSNVLTCHGGEIWLHVMESTRNILEDPPSISEGMGGRVTDYRITDFVEFMKQNIMVPYPPDPLGNNKGSGKLVDVKRNDGTLKPFEKAKDRLHRKTVYWPITFSGSILFSLSVHLDNLLQLFPRDNLNEIEKVACDKNFWSLMAIEARGDNPPVSSAHMKKGLKTCQQWRIVYAEIEKFLRANLYSESHHSVLECFIESRRKDDSDVDGIPPPKGVPPVMEGQESGGTKKRSAAAVEPPLSPPPNKKQKVDPTDLDVDPSSAKMNLLAYWTLKTEKKSSRVLPQVIKLYSHLTESQDKDKERMPK